MSKILIIFLLISSTSHSVAQELFGLENSSEHSVRLRNLETSNDPDVQQAVKRKFFSPRNTHYYIVTFTDINNLKWILQVFENKLKSGPSFFVPHDSENDSFQVGARAIKKFGGHLITLECQEKRLCGKKTDPNRYFKLENLIFTSTILRFFKNKNYPVITLHNNHDSHRELGGRGAIYSDMATPYTNGVGHYYAGDPDDLIIYADRFLIDSSYIYKKYFTLFKDNKLNNIFEFIQSKQILKGHMSSYILLNTNLEYFNIEGQHGHEEKQFNYLSKLVSISI